MTLRPATTLLLACLACLLSGPAAAQLPPANLISYSPDQVAAIRDFISQQAARMGGDDDDAVMEGRRSMVAALTQAGVSVSFRGAFSAAALPELERLAGNNRDWRAINALIVAGELATDSSVALLDRYREDPRAGVRFAAVNGYGRTFEAMLRSSPAIDTRQAQQVVRHLGAVIARDEDRDVLAAAVRALLAAIRLDNPRDSQGPVVRAAYDELFSNLSQRLGKPSDREMGDQLVRLSLASMAKARDLLVAQRPWIDANRAKAAAALAGDTIAHLMRRIDEKHYPAGDQGRRIASIQALSAAQTLLAATHDRLGGNSSGAIPDLAAEFQQATDAGDAAFRRAARALLGALLEGPPFNFPANRFLRGG